MRMTISVPDDLARRMKKTRGVIWSRLAASAFESRLAEMAASRGSGRSKMSAGSAPPVGGPRRVDAGAPVALTLDRPDGPVTLKLRRIRRSAHADVLVALEAQYAPGSAGLAAMTIETLVRYALVGADGLRDADGVVVKFVSGPEVIGGAGAGCRLELAALEVVDALTDAEIAAVLAVAVDGADPANTRAGFGESDVERRARAGRSRAPASRV